MVDSSPMRPLLDSRKIQYGRPRERPLPTLPFRVEGVCVDSADCWTRILYGPSSPSSLALALVPLGSTDHNRACVLSETQYSMSAIPAAGDAVEDGRCIIYSTAEESRVEENRQRKGCLRRKMSVSSLFIQILLFARFVKLFAPPPIKVLPPYLPPSAPSLPSPCSPRFPPQELGSPYSSSAIVSLPLPTPLQRP